jgi:putative DNA primase/helicase
VAKRIKSTDKPTDDTATKPKRVRAKTRGPQTVPEVEGNAIEFAEEPSSAGAGGGTLRAGRAAKDKREAKATESTKSREAARAKPSIPEKRAQPIPDTVRERFIQIGNSFFFPDGAEAFTDHGDRVTTRSENAVVIQSMVAIARERAASAVTVAGTDLFKKEAWFAARLVGLDVAGYKPTALERERLVRAIARRRDAKQGEEPSMMDTPTTRDDEKSQRPRGAPSSAPPRDPTEGEIIVGRLVDHGPAPYQHKPNQPMSYYVRIETKRGDREIWGVDLERAFRQSLSTPGIGQEVGVRAVGRDPVTVPATKRDAEGREIGREERHTHRNQWSVESKEFLDRRREMADVFRDAAVGAADAIRKFPELEGSYLQLQIARAGLEGRIESRAAREQFVEHLRGHLAKAIQYGQALEPVRLKARGEEPEKTQERDHAPAR